MQRPRRLPDGHTRADPLPAENAAPLDATVPYRYYQGEVFRCLEAMVLVGAEGSPEYPELAVSEQERAHTVPVAPCRQVINDR
jgi:hypothetical protein